MSQGNLKHFFFWGGGKKVNKIIKALRMKNFIWNDQLLSKCLQEVSAVGTLPFETEGLKHYRTTTGLPRYLPCYASFISLLLNLGLSNCHLFQPYEPAIMKESAFFPITQQEQPITTFLNPNHLQLLWVLKFSLLEKKTTDLPFPGTLISMPFTEQFH